jgi:hypothetical protein
LQDVRTLRNIARTCYTTGAEFAVFFQGLTPISLRPTEPLARCQNLQPDIVRRCED